MKTSLLLSALTLTLSASVSQAKPDFLEAIKAQYPEAVFTARCQTCHRVGALLNPFGKDFQTLVKNDLSDQQGWESLKALDSDADGVINYDEFVANTNPGKADQPQPQP
jgi:cytochrome c2